MLQRLIAAVLAVLGLVAIALGIASATAWRADDTLTASGTTADGTTLLTTATGVLELGDPPVTVRATAPAGTKVVLAVGRDTDVAGWVGTDAHTVVTGLSDWDVLATEEVAATSPAPADGAAEPAPAEDAPPQPAPDPDGSDLWVDQATGDGSAELVWEPRDGRWTLLAAGVGADPGALTVELSWPRTVTTPWLVPGVAGGVVLLLVAAVLLALARRRRRADEWHTVASGAIPVVGGDATGDSDAAASTRRERRDAAAAAARQARPWAPRTGEVATVPPATGATPGVETPPVPASGAAALDVPTHDAAPSDAAPSEAAVADAAVPSDATPYDAAAVPSPVGSGAPTGAVPRSSDATTGEVPVVEGVARSVLGPGDVARGPGTGPTPVVVPGSSAPRPAAAPAAQDDARVESTAGPTPAASGSTPGVSTAPTAPTATDGAGASSATGFGSRLGGVLRSLRGGPAGAGGASLTPADLHDPSRPGSDVPEGAGGSPVPSAGRAADAVPDATPDGAARRDGTAPADPPAGGVDDAPGEPSATGPRADAWRRAWGFPGAGTAAADADPREAAGDPGATGAGSPAASTDPIDGTDERDAR